MGYGSSEILLDFYGKGPSFSILVIKDYIWKKKLYTSRNYLQHVERWKNTKK
jgi:hypothetical protein